jgi:hypothetical protein
MPTLAPVRGGKTSSPAKVNAPKRTKQMKLVVPNEVRHDSSNKPIKEPTTKKTTRSSKTPEKSNEDPDETEDESSHDEEKGEIKKKSVTNTHKLIARNEFDPDRELTMRYVIELLGDQATRTKSSDIQTKFQDTKALKESAAEFMQVMIERKVVELASKDPNIRDTSIKGLQKAWKNMNMKKSKDVSNIQNSFWRFTQPGSSGMFPLHWDKEMEVLFMKKHSLEYKRDETLDNKKGCLARMATRAIRNLRKKLFFQAKKKQGHQMILSACRTGIPGERRPQLRRKSLVYKKAYTRKSVRLVGQVEPEESGENENEDDDNEDDSEGENVDGEKEGGSEDGDEEESEKKTGGEDEESSKSGEEDKKPKAVGVPRTKKGTAGLTKVSGMVVWSRFCETVCLR